MPFTDVRGVHARMIGPTGSCLRFGRSGVGKFRGQLADDKFLDEIGRRHLRQSRCLRFRTLIPPIAIMRWIVKI
jgi:hypothetical protein